MSKELDQFAAEAATLDASAAPQQPEAQATDAAPAAPNLADEITGLASMAVAALAPALPSLKTIYTPETTAAAAEAIARVCQKHGWLQNGIGGEYAEEISAAFILIPLGISTYQGVKGDIAAAKAKSLAAPSQTPSTPEQVASGELPMVQAPEVSFK